MGWVDGGDGLDLLDDESRARAKELRRYVRSRYDRDPAACRAAADAISNAIAAAFAGDQAAVAACLAEGEAVVAGWRDRAAANDARHATDAVAARRRKEHRRLAAAELAARDRVRSDTAAAVNSGISGQVPVARPDPYLVVAVDGSYGSPFGGWAYVTSDGRWGLAAERIGHDPSGPLTCELAAAGLAARVMTRDAVLVIDSLAALGWVRRWRSGAREVPGSPGGGSPAGARQTRRHTIVAAAAEQVARRPGLAAEHVYGHRGHALNEAADMLAKMARRARSGADPAPLDLFTARCGPLVAAFLASWYGQGMQAGPGGLLPAAGSST